MLEIFHVTQHKLPPSPLSRELRRSIALLNIRLEKLSNKLFHRGSRVPRATGVECSWLCFQYNHRVCLTFVDDDLRRRRSQKCCYRFY